MITDLWKSVLSVSSAFHKNNIMKHPFFILILSFFILHFSSAQQYGWVDLSANIPEINNVNKALQDIQFIGQEGWIAGGIYNDNPRVYHTTDGGQTFSVQYFPVSSGDYATGIHMRDALEGYTVTNAGHVLRTVDGGNNWITIGTGLGLLYSVSFPPLPDTSGYICGGSGGKICRVTGSTITIEWTHPQSLYSIVFPVNSTEGWVCGGPTIRHRNSTGWVIGDQNYSTGNGYHAIHFTDNQHGWAVGGPNSGQGTIIYTTDGANWFGVPNVPDKNLTDVYFIDSQEGWAVGNYIILHTTDGGLTWIEDPTPLADSTFFYSVFAVNNHDVYVCGGKGIGDLQKQVFLKYTRVDGVEDAEAALWSVYPNPTTGKFQITSTKSQINSKFQNQKSQIEIVDLFGKVVENINLQPATCNLQFDIAGLPSGIYFVKIHLENQVIVKKFIKI
jgi:photosystem II stability/assembly factor-like uncharacterized protein